MPGGEVVACPRGAENAYTRHAHRRLRRWEYFQEHPTAGRAVGLGRSRHLCVLIEGRRRAPRRQDLVYRSEHRPDVAVGDLFVAQPVLDVGARLLRRPRFQAGLVGH